MEPEFYDAQYNLGVLYYNKAVKIYEEASKITDNTEFEKVSAQGNEVLLQAVPYMERASQLDPNDKFSLETLKTIYYRMKMTDKYNEVVSKLNNM